MFTNKHKERDDDSNKCPKTQVKVKEEKVQVLY